MTRDVLGNDPFARLGRKPSDEPRRRARPKRPRKKGAKAKTILSPEASKPKRKRRKSKAGLKMAAAEGAGPGTANAVAAPVDPARVLEARLAARRSRTDASAPQPATRASSARSLPPSPPKPLSRLETLAREVGRFLYEHYFRVEAEGASRVPVRGPVLLVANHAGMIPYDVLMLQLALERRPGGGRSARWVPGSLSGGTGLLAALFAGRGPLTTGGGKAAAALAAGEVAISFPETEAGLLKTWSERFRLMPFAQVDVFREALAHGAAVVPVAVIGSEEAHPILFRLPFGNGEIPVTPTWPLLGPLGLVPAPSRWRLRFGEPIAESEFEGADLQARAESLQHVARRRLTGLLADLIAERKSLFR